METARRRVTGLYRNQVGAIRQPVSISAYLHNRFACDLDFDRIRTMRTVRGVLTDESGRSARGRLC